MRREYIQNECFCFINNVSVDDSLASEINRGDKIFFFVIN